MRELESVPCIRIAQSCDDMGMNSGQMSRVQHSPSLSVPVGILSGCWRIVKFKPKMLSKLEELDVPEILSEHIGGIVFAVHK